MANHLCSHSKQIMTDVCIKPVLFIKYIMTDVIFKI